MKAVQISSYKNKKADMAFFIYFTVMALLFTKTFIQLAAQLGIIAYCIYVAFFKSSLFEKKQSFKNVKFLILWFGIFTVFVSLSTQWAYSKMPGSNTILTLYRILAVGIALYMYVTDFSKAVSVVKSFLYSNVVMAIVVLLTTPLSQYGKAGEEGFGTFIGQSRNVFGAVMSFSILLCIMFYKYEGFRHGKKMVVFFVFALLCSGSRGAMLQLLIILGLYVITIPGFAKKLKYIVIAIFGVAIAFVLLQNIPFLHDIVWVRFENLINTVLGIEEMADTSALGRELYKVLAWEMFEKRPILGHGVDGFVCMLRDVQYVEGYYLPPRYSHCNYTEIAANFGAVGLVLWYLPVAKVIIDSYKLRQKAYAFKIVFIILTSMVILDYARIPWMTHMTMYTYFLIFMLYLMSKRNISLEKAYKSEFGSL